MEAFAEAEITGIVASKEKKMIVSVGWSRRIVTYDDDQPDNNVVDYNPPWKGEHKVRRGFSLGLR